ncbi:MAG: DUF4145 domain-containing protein [Luteitalea sp.]
MARSRTSGENRLGRPIDPILPRNEVSEKARAIQGVEPAISFDDKLRRLVDDGRIGGDEKKILAVLVDAGGAAAHRSWRPRRDQLDTMLDAIESFLHRALIVKDGIAKLEAAVPAKQKRRPGNQN